MNRKLFALLLVGAMVMGAFLAVAGCDFLKGPATTTAMVSITKLTVATDALYPPFESVDSVTSEIVGFDMDLMREIAKAGGFEVEFVNTPWEGIFVGLNNGNYDAVMSAVSITPDRQKEYDFSDPYFTIYQALIVRKADAEKYKSLADLKGKKVGAQMGTTGDMFVEKNTDVQSVKYEDNATALEALLKGDVDAVVCDDRVAFDYALVNPAFSDKLEVTNPKVNPEPEPYGICIKKGNTKVLDMINTGLRAVTPEKLDEIKTKWNLLK